MDLDPNLWRHLPPELLYLILSKLQSVDLMRTRPVCKEWNKRILTRQLKSDQVVAAKRVVVYCRITRSITSRSRQNSVSICCRSKNMLSWMSVVLANLQEDVDRSSVHLTATSRGLLVFYGLRGTDLFVCNPVTKASDFVQIGHIPSPLCMGLICSPESYQLVIISNLGAGGNEPHFYDSATRSWSTGALGPSRTTQLTSGFICADSFYFLNCAGGDIGFEVWKYKMPTQSWSTIPIPTDTLRTSSAVGIAHCKGRVMLLTAVLFGNLRIHELVEGENGVARWKSIHLMPDDLLYAVHAYLGTRPEDNQRYWHVSGDGDSIYVVGYGPREGNAHHSLIVVLEYDPWNDCWVWLQHLFTSALSPEDFHVLRPSLDGFPLSR